MTKSSDYIKQLEEQVAALEQKLEANDCETKSFLNENEELKQELGPLYWTLIASFNRSTCQSSDENEPMAKARKSIVRDILDHYKFDKKRDKDSETYGIFTKDFEDKEPDVLCYSKKDGKWQTDDLKEKLHKYILDHEDPWEDAVDND